MDAVGGAGGSDVQRIVPESYLHVAAVSRRSQRTASAKALMAKARRYAVEREQVPGRKQADTAEMTDTATK